MTPSEGFPAAGPPAPSPETARGRRRDWLAGESAAGVWVAVAIPWAHDHRPPWMWAATRADLETRLGAWTSG